MQRENLVYNLLVNLTVLTAVAGIVVLLANNLTAIPAELYLGVFGALALILTIAGLLSRRRDKKNATQILSFYAGIVLGLVIFAGGHFYGFATFIPDLLLLWMVGLTLLAFLFASVGQMALVALLNLVWLYMTFLYGMSYWPGLILIICLYWFAWQRHTSIPLFLLAAINSLVILNLYGYDLVHPTHFPLAFSSIHILVTFAFFGMMSGLAGITWRNIPPWSPWLRYSRALIWMTTVVGLGVLLYLITPGSWVFINNGFDGRLIGIVAGMGIYMCTAVFVFSRPTMPGTRSRFLLWTVGFMLLVSGLNDLMMPFAYQQYLTLILGLLAMGVGLALLWGAVVHRCLWRLGLGLTTLAVSTAMVMMSWVEDYMTQSMIFFALALVMAVTIWRLRRKPKPVAVRQAVPIAGRRVKEVPA
ncbi:MAG TPA: hypothetical protein P5121_37060 [Caldilineaceae bacterium]|nr:hypothetical protein [Caldilineaceae bacterium]